MTKDTSDYLLLYDEACPVCTAASCGLVRSGFLPDEGRRSYQSVAGELTEELDLQRAANEIALVNRSTGEVTYGAQSLLLIMQQRYPAFAPLWRARPFAWLCHRAYRFVAFNRRVLLPARDAYTVQPSFHVGYRLTYLGLTWLITASFLHSYCRLLVPLTPPTSYGREFLICGGQIFWQLPVVMALHKGKTWDYLGNMMTISFAGGVALGMIQLLLSPFVSSPFLYGALFTVVAGSMFLEHIRRTRILQVSSWLTATWVLYRVLLLGLVLWQS